MTRRINKLQINAQEASNNQILVARGGALVFDDASNVFVGDSQEANAAQTANFANTAGFANVSLEANFANTAGIANVSLEANFANTAGFANVSLLANVANTVVTLSNFTTDNLAESSSNLYYTNARVLSAVNPILTTANVTELSSNLYFTNARVLAAVTGQQLTLSNLVVLNNITSNTVVADSLTSNTIVSNSFASSGTGVPTIESATSINLSANGMNGGAVVIQNSALRLRSYSDGDVANLTATAGDVVFNSSNSRIQFYDGNAWLTLNVT